MSEHLPECHVSMADFEPSAAWITANCICHSLRACEQRVEAEWLDRYNYDPDLVWEDALDVARQAVKEICQQNPLIWPTDEAAMQALDAAIDVLKEGGTKEYKVRSTWSAALDAARQAVAALHQRVPVIECACGWGKDCLECGSESNRVVGYACDRCCNSFGDHAYCDDMHYDDDDTPLHHRDGVMWSGLHCPTLAAIDALREET